MVKCKCWREAPGEKEYNTGLCFGTKEIEHCSCNGDETKCDFYPKVRQKAHDAVHVIRCADCAYYGKSPLGHPHIGWCRIDCKHRKPGFYCANADGK